MKRCVSLNGEWNLYYADACDREPVDFVDVTRRGIVPSIPAQVPGNVELDLSRAGLLPEDLFKGMNTEVAMKYESYDFWYRKEFETPEMTEEEEPFLCFDGVDCFATYYLNGEVLGTSENAFMPHSFSVKGKLNPVGKNVLFVQLRSARMEEFAHDYDSFMLSAWGINALVFQRKPAHSGGWDICPRALTAGLWKEVRLELRTPYQVTQVSYDCRLNPDGSVRLRIPYVIQTLARPILEKRLSVRAKGICGDSSFEVSEILRYRGGRLEVEIPNAKLWWPYGYGDANLYETVFEVLLDGEVVAEHSFNIGLRSLELRRTDTVEAENSCFQFVINGVNVMCRGSNWVPLDAYHSRDIDRYEKAMELVSDVGCNILRVWGGGVYEQPYFYDYCDKHGIMIWHDFMMACHVCPLDDAMLANMKEEFTWAIKELRNHPSIILWAGDNEMDMAFVAGNINPDINRITRELLPQLVAQHDPTRPYLPSSPYVSGKAWLEKQNGTKKKASIVEDHLWGARDYYKAAFYTHSPAYFVSESGYHGCPNKESLEKMVDADCVWPCWNEQWTLHSSDQRGSNHRVRLMDDQIMQLFGFRAENLDDFILASQISQAEAKKYFIERIRIGKSQGKSGIIWWNLLDGWPQMSDAVVDYYYSKKLAYSYIKRCQVPFAIMIDELRDWCYPIVASNDTMKTVCGSYKISDIDTGDVYAQGEFCVAPNENFNLGKIRMMYSEQKMLLIEWTVDGKTSYNHYLCGYPGFDFEQYKVWLNKLQEICGE